MLVAVFVVAILIEIGLPFAIARWSTRRYSVGWSLFWIGFLTYFGAQVINIPVVGLVTGLFHNGTLPAPPENLALLFNAGMVALSGALFQEIARWIAFRVLKNRAQTWGAAITLGAGHGGLEMVLVGLSVLVNLVLVMIFANNPHALPFLGSMGQAIFMQAQSFWTQAWYLPLLGAFERIAGLAGQLVLTVMVWLAVTRRNALWFVLALLWHTILDAIPALGMSLAWGYLQMESLVGFFLIINLVILAALRQWTRLQEQRTAAPLETQPESQL